jgi:hypothetical protein
MELRQVFGIAVGMVSLSAVTMAVGNAGDDDSAVVSQLHKLGQAVLLYADVHDGKMPLQCPNNLELNTNGSSMVSVPEGWTRTLSPERAAQDATAWPNSTARFLSEPALLAIEGAPETRRGIWSYDNPLVPPQSVGFSYNGLLSGFAKSGIAHPEKVPLVWTGNGKSNRLGYVCASPYLNCENPSMQACRFNEAEETQSGRTFTFDGDAKAFPKGMYFAMADGSVKHVEPGAANNEPGTDPFAKYSPDNKPESYWTDGRYPTFFRPDR